MKPYETPEHLGFLKVVRRQVSYVKSNVKDGNKQKIAGKSGDVLVEVLMVLTGYYEELGEWLSNEKLHLAHLRTALDLKTADIYIQYKNEGETNETSRTKARLDCREQQEELNEVKHAWDVIEAWKKAIARYHSAVVSALGYEKSLAYMSRGN